MKIVPGIHWIKGINCNVYIIVDKELTLIDTGLPHKAKKILAYITDELKHQPSELKTIILTHCDIDHIGSVLDLKQITGAKVLSHPEDAEIIAGRKQRQMPKGDMNIMFKLFAPFMKVKPFEVDQKVNDSDEVCGLKVIHVPGHTPGSIALYDPAKKALFTGDSLLCGEGKVNGLNQRATSDMETAKRSIQNYKDLDFEAMFPGHGEPLNPGASAKVREFLGPAL